MSKTKLSEWIVTMEGGYIIFERKIIWQCNTQIIYQWILNSDLTIV